MFIYDLVYDVTFGLAFTISLLCFGIENRRRLTSIFVFIIVCVSLYVYIIFRQSDDGDISNTIYYLSLALFVSLSQILINKEIVPSYFLKTLTVSLICIISDALGVTLGRMLFSFGIQYSVARLVYCALLPIIATLISAIIRFLYIKLRRQFKNTKLLFIAGITGIAFLLVFLVFFWSSVGIWENIRYTVTSFLIAFIIIGLLGLSVFYHSSYMRLKIEKEIREKEIANIIQSAKIIEVTYEKLRSFRHDYKNIVLSLSLKGNDEESEKLREIEKDLTFMNFQYENIVIQLLKINNLPFRSLMSLKTFDFINHNISVEIMIMGEIKDFYMDDFDLVRMLGIFLDNAFEEAENTESRWIRIGLLPDVGSTTLIIENSCRETAPATVNIMRKGFSTKGEERGIGLSNVSEIFERYKFCSFAFGKREPTVFYVETTLRTC